tara:strand:+ start:656 stop:1516 length:861 start_codon:yes stop_codon:yes gene_type:complete
MSEITQESISDNGQVDTEAAAIDDFELGEDLVDDSDPVDLTSDNATPTVEIGSTSKSEESADLSKIDPKTASEPDRALLADYTRKTQQLGELRRQAQHSLQEAEQAKQDALQHRVERLENPTSDDMFADIRSNLSADESNALDVIAQVDDIKNGEFREAVASEVQQLRSMVQRLATVALSNMGQQAQAKVLGLREQYPDIDNFKDHIAALSKVNNPATGKKYSAEEAYKMVNGIAISESQALDNRHRQTRRQPTTTPPATTATGNGNGQLSDNELTAAMNELGFGS